MNIEVGCVPSGPNATDLVFRLDARRDAEQIDPSTVMITEIEILDDWVAEIIRIGAREGNGALRLWALLDHVEDWSMPITQILNPTLEFRNRLKEWKRWCERIDPPYGSSVWRDGSSDQVRG
ncbi:MAG: hypothetical protein ABL901_09600 [Hyphomicrobiaceae bacterium]